jgi:hypothetical protein
MITVGVKESNISGADSEYLKQKMELEINSKNKNIRSDLYRRIRKVKLSL